MNLQTMIHLTVNLWIVKMAKMVMEIAYKYQFQTMSKIQNMKQILKMGWEWIFHSDPGPRVRPFLGEEMPLIDWEKNEPDHFFETLRLKCGTILPMKLTNMQKQGLHKDISKNKYLLFYILLFFSTCCMILIIFSTFSFFMISWVYIDHIFNMK